MNIKKEIMKEFREKFYLPKGIEGWSVQGTITEQLDFLSQALTRIEQKTREEMQKEEKRIYDRAKDLENFILDNSMQSKGYSSIFQEKACILVGMLTAGYETKSSPSEEKEDSGEKECFCDCHDSNEDIIEYACEKCDCSPKKEKRGR